MDVEKARLLPNRSSERDQAYLLFTTGYHTIQPQVADDHSLALEAITDDQARDKDVP